MGKQFLVLQGRGTYVEQTLYNLQRGNVYEMRLRMANRPGYGDDERLLVKMDNHLIGESGHPPDDFGEYGVAFTARSDSSVLHIENDTPNGHDSSVFIDQVTVTPILLGEPVSLTNPNFDAADRGSKDYNYVRTPSCHTRQLVVSPS